LQRGCSASGQTAGVRKPKGVQSGTKGDFMGIPRIAGLISAVALAIGLSTAMAGAAQAAVAPTPGINYEITSPFLTPNPLCVDVPGGSTSTGTPLQLFHCHGTDSQGAIQLWRFDRVGGTNDRPIYQIVNLRSRLCLEVANTTGAPGTRIVQGSCILGSQSEWQILDNATGFINDPNPNDFELNAFIFGECMTAANSSDNNQTPLVLGQCTAGRGTQLNTFRLG
jgi:hypothetical protein